MNLNILSLLVNYYTGIVIGLVKPAIPPARQYFALWLFVKPFHLWHQVCRYEGYTFFKYMFSITGSSWIEKVMRFRIIFLMVTLFWPLVALALALRHRKNWLNQWKYGIIRPDLRAAYPFKDLGQIEVSQMNSEFLTSIAHSFEYHRRPQEYFSLDCKINFTQACLQNKFPVPKTLSLEEALKWEDDVVLKDARMDLGKGVKIITSKNELNELILNEHHILQPKLRSHRDIRDLLPDGAALSTCRIVTMIEDGEYRTVLSFFRFPKEGAIVDNVAAGGLASNVDLKTNTLLPAFDKKMMRRFQCSEMPHIHKIPGALRSITGFSPPFFREARALCESVHRKLSPDAFIVGFDVAICDDGPVLLELNICTGSYEHLCFSNLYNRSLDSFYKYFCMDIQTQHAVVPSIGVS